VPAIGWAVRDAIRVRHYGRRTEEAYVTWIRRYIVFHHKTHPSKMGAPEIAAFLTSLAVRERVSASRQNQALSALLFLYRNVLAVDVGSIEPVPRARTPTHVPVVLSRDEVKRIMEQLSGIIWITVALLSGAGLRLRDCLDGAPACAASRTDLQGLLAPGNSSTKPMYPSGTWRKTAVNYTSMEL